MLRKLQQFFIPILLSFITACSGGDALDPEALKAKQTPTNAQEVTPIISNTVAELKLTGASVVPVGQNTYFTLTALNAGGALVPNATITASVSGKAIINNAPATSGSGSVNFSVSDSIAETVMLSIVSGEVNLLLPISFGGQVSAQVIGGGQPANGTSKVQLVARALDHAGLPLVALPVSLSFSTGSFAVATNASGKTDANGIFSTDITDTVAETLSVTPIIGGVHAQSFSLTFSAVALAKPHSVTLSLGNNNALAGGQAAVSITVVARAEDGTPIKDVPVSLSVSSGSAVLANASGQTSLSGAFTTSMTNTVAESVIVTPTAGGVVGDSKQAIFVLPSEGVDKANTVTTVELFLSRSQGLYANGQDSATITLIARGVNGAPVAGVPASLILSGGSAKLAIEAGNTDTSGRFITQITDLQVDTFTITGAVGNARSTPKQIQFVAVAVDSNVDVIPTNVDLVISNDGQLANGQAAVNLTVVVRDNKNTPMSGVDVVLSSSSGSALLAAATGKTGAGGSFTTQITNTVAEKVTINASARGINGAPKTVEFIGTKAVNVALVSTTITDNNRLANGQEATTLTVIARDSENRPVEGAQVILVFSSAYAIPAQATGQTSAGGSFVTTISDTMAETFTVVARIGDKASAPQSITFEPSSTTTPPAKITTTVSQDGQAANGVAEVQVTVIARDANNTPLQNVPVSLATSSGSALLNPASGTTGATGAFISKITNTVAETVTITPTAGGVTGAPVTLSFENSPTGAKPAAVTITSDVDSANANGSSKITLTVVARNQVGSPIVGAAVSIALSSKTGTPAALFDAVLGATGLTNAAGTFSTSLTSNKVEELVVTPTVAGITGTSKTIKFVQPVLDETTPASLELLSSSPQLLSEGTTDGIKIIALVKTGANTPYSKADVKFSATSGMLQVTKGTTDDAGQAEAKLTTIGDPINRTITVTATVGTLTKTLDINVVGTTLGITGTTAVVQNSTVKFAVELKDSSGKGIVNHPLKLLVDNNNVLKGDATRTTDGNGRVELEVEAKGSGASTLKAEVVNATHINTTHRFNIADDTFTIDPANITAGVPLGQVQTFTVTWLKSGAAQANKQLNISATRGVLGATIIATNFAGQASFSISSNNAGPSIVTVSAVDGPSNSVSFDFIATIPSTMELQANPGTIPTNTPGSDTEKSEIIAIVRDTNGNLVKNQRVEFTVNDITGGRISPSSALTDSFGRATTSYIAGSSSSASNGVTVSAQVIGTGISAFVKLTVAQRGVFISLGTGNDIGDLNTTTYRLPYTVLVTDINGGPVSDAKVTLSIVPRAYGKGLYCYDLTSKAWTAKNRFNAYVNEDSNQNGILDAGEDANSDGILQPGNNATLSASTLTTSTNGFADFDVLYPKVYATWVEVALIAKTTVVGTEDSTTAVFTLPFASKDKGTEEVSPVFRVSPFDTDGYTCS